mgnify:FL=1
MEYFFGGFFGALFSGIVLTEEVLLLFVIIIALVMVLLLSLVILKISKYEALSKVETRRELRFLKRKWEVMERPHKRSFEAYLGLDGIGIGHEYDDRKNP